MRCQKKETRLQFFVLTSAMNRTSKVPCETHVLFMWSLETKKCGRVFFFDTAILQKKFLRFDPTLGSNNSGLKNYRIKNHHIFGISRTSAFIWHIWIPLKNFQADATRLRLHSFGPFWTIFTGSQWEISEVGRLSCFIEFFAWFHIVCGRYTSD